MVINRSVDVLLMERAEATHIDVDRSRTLQISDIIEILNSDIQFEL